MKEGQPLVGRTYITCAERKCRSVYIHHQSRGRFFGAQLIQFLLQNKPLDLQLGSRSLRHCNLLPPLLQCMSPAELVDPG